MSAVTITFSIILTILLIYLIVMVGVLSAETGTYKQVLATQQLLSDANNTLVTSVKSKYSIA